ncbi:acyl-CoA synthetase [Haloprofundus halobius]|uniref:acyl-CoA synthetase n=1 Tax=Haloprofundus halobius TaxID=2876194 RepID=UPI001CCDFE1F|nr:AMP-binding protein [Haloprofundus halobius]
MVWQIMPRYESYEQARREFAWNLPDRYNPATDFLRKHDDTERVALRYENPDGPSETYTFRDLDDRSDRLAAAFAELGIEAGDRVGVVVPQKPENPITHLANWKLGAVSVPLTVLFGPDALEYRLVDSGARAVVVDPAVRDEIDEIRDACPDLEHVVELGTEVHGDAHAFDRLVADHDTGIDAYDSTPETPSAIMYTSGSTGPPKGVLHSHALWLGRAAAAYNYFDQGLHDATLWTPADWAWGAALGGTLFAALHHGCTIVGWPRDGFDPDDVFGLMARHGVTKAFMPPTALRMLMTVGDPTERYDLSVETLAAVGEPLTPEILEWVDETFDDVPVNEFYGQTELNLVVGNSSNWFEAQPGSMGKPLPGYDVAVVDQETRERLPTGEPGELAVRPADERLFFDEYWGLPEKTAAKKLDGGWFLTDDIVTQDGEGYLWFVSRADDVILTSGYRVGPMEVEKAILQHPAVEQAGVVGVPDDTRGEAIKAFVQPTGETTDEEKLREEIEKLVRERLAAYEYPRYIEFADELPTTSTGKIRRLDLREGDER